MVFQLRWQVVFFTIFWSSFYTSSAEDIKEIAFTISSPWNYGRNAYDNKCVGGKYDLQVGDQFQVYVSYGDNKVNNVGRCLKSQASEDFEQTSFRDVTYSYSYISVRNVTVTLPGEWNYECVFYFNQCTFKGNKCNYKGWVRTFEDPGVRCSTKLHVKKVIEPSGYLTANGVNFSPNDTEHIYKFHEGENTKFTCHKTTGNWAKLSYPVKEGEQNSTSPTWAESVNISLELRAAYNFSTVDCIIHGDRTQQLLSVRLILNEDEQGGVWIGLAVVVLILLLCVAGLTLAIRYKKKKRLLKNNPPTVAYQKQPTVTPPQPERPDEVTYAEPYSIHNIYTKQQINTNRNNLDQPTYLNSEQINNEPTYALVQNSEPGYALVQNSEPGYALVQNSEPGYALVQNSEPGYASMDNSELTYASVHNIVPNFASVKNSELNFASVKNSVQKSKDAHSNPTYANQNSIEKDNNTKKKDDNKKSAKVAKKEKKPKHDKRPKKKNAVTYADLNHSAVNVSNISAPKVPAHSHANKLNSINHQYENGHVNNDIEPAYCEIIPTKK